MKPAWLIAAVSLLSIQSFTLADSSRIAPTIPHIGTHSFVPGKSFGPVSLGMRRAEAITVMRSKPNYKFRHGGYSDDVWLINKETDLDVLYRRGAVVQIDLTHDNILSTPFKNILASKRWSLHLTIYDMDFPEMGSYVGYYYDDIKQGICFAGGAQDDFILELYGPDRIIIHRPGRHAIAFDSGIIGKVSHDLEDGPYATQAAADKADKISWSKHQ